MRYGILGPLEVAGAKLRALLVLLLDANRVVSVDRLIEELWGGRPPPRATVTLRSYVSMLRRVVEPERAPGATSAVLAWQPPGYVLRVGPDDLDATRFERLARDGRAVLPSDPVAAETMLGEALALWRGDALADVAFEPFAQGEVARLGELRLATAEDQVEARLAAGRHAEVVPDPGCRSCAAWPSSSTTASCGRPSAPAPPTSPRSPPSWVTASPPRPRPPCWMARRRASAPTTRSPASSAGWPPAGRCCWCSTTSTGPPCRPCVCSPSWPAASAGSRRCCWPPIGTARCAPATRSPRPLRGWRASRWPGASSSAASARRRWQPCWPARPARRCPTGSAHGSTAAPGGTRSCSASWPGCS